MKLMEMGKFPLKVLLGRREYVLVVGLCIIIGGILGFLLLLCRVEVLKWKMVIFWGFWNGFGFFL